MSAVTPSTSEYAVDGASVNEQIQRIVADLPQVNAHLENAHLKAHLKVLPNRYHHNDEIYPIHLNPLRARRNELSKL